MKVRLTTNHGPIILQLYDDKAPATVTNFLAYVRGGFYDSTLFHRVIKDFMIQGGGLDTEMRRKPAGEPIRNEADNGLSNLAGTVSMARTPDPHSASSQFFINTRDNLFLNHTESSAEGWGYCVFGEVCDGMETVRRIEATPTGMQDGHADVPVEPVIIQQAEHIDD